MNLELFTLNSFKMRYNAIKTVPIFYGNNKSNKVTHSLITFGIIIYNNVLLAYAMWRSDKADKGKSKNHDVLKKSNFGFRH